MAGDRVPGGFPKPIIKSDYEYRLYCGGKGGGGCPVLVGVDRTTWAIENDPFAVRNRLLVLKDDGTKQFYKDAGPTAFCDHSEGEKQPFWVAVSVDGVLTVDEIKAQNVQGGLQAYGTTQFYEFDDTLLPQPSDAGYAGVTYVTVYWGDANYVGFQMTSDYRLFPTELNLHDVRI